MGYFFPKTSLDIGSILVKKSLEVGPIHKYWKKNCKSAIENL